MNAGVRVIGVCSAGALRAIELEKHGMNGCGVIHQLYKRRLLTDDGELASPLEADSFDAIAPATRAGALLLGIR